jgi:hypothetical protein
MLERTVCFLAIGMMGFVGCGGSSSNTSIGSDSIVGVWTRSETNGAARTEIYLLINADKTHEWLGKTTQTNGTVTVTTDGPCGKGTYVYGNDGSLTLTTDYVTYAGTVSPTKVIQTKTETFAVERIDDSLRFNKSIVYQKGESTGGLLPVS